MFTKKIQNLRISLYIFRCIACALLLITEEFQEMDFCELQKWEKKKSFAMHL